MRLVNLEILLSDDRKRLAVVLGAELKKALWDQLDRRSYEFRGQDDADQGIRLIAEKLWQQSFVPDTIASIYDPGASGGREVGYRLSQHFENAETIEIEVRTISGERKVVAVEDWDRSLQDQPVRILVVDDVAPSGRTIDRAVQAWKEMNPLIEARIGVLSLLAG